MLHSICEGHKSEKCERNSPAGTLISEEGGGGGDATGTRTEIPLQPVMKTMIKQPYPFSPWRSRDPPAACGELQARADRDALKEGTSHVDPMEEQPPGSSHDLWGTHAGTVPEGC